MPENTAARRFRTFFTAACIDLRTTAGASQSLAADRAGVGENSVRRFEKGEIFPAVNLDQYAASYASLSSEGIDGRDVFARAVALWKSAAGRAPLTADEIGDYAEPSAHDVLDAIRAARTVQEHAQADAPPNATRSRRTGGG